MRKLIFLFVLLSGCALAQVQPQIQGAGAPGNPCLNGGQQYLDTTNHVLYNCSVPGQNWVNIGQGNLTGGGGVSTAAGVVALFTSCSGTQSLGADGACHSAGSGTVTSVATTAPITGGTVTTTGTIACATCAIGPGVSTINHLAKFSGTDGVTLADGGAIPAGTVTNTGGSLTANSLVLGAGTNDSKVIAGLTSDGTAGLNVGATGVGGTLTIFGTTSGSNTITAVGNGTALNLSAATLKIGATNGTIQAGGGTLGIVSVSTITVTPGATGTLFAFGPIGFSGGKGQHFVTQAANNDLVGTVSVSASTTASVVFTTNYTAAPVCVLTPQTTGITSWFLSAISVSGFTVTVAPSGTYTFGYHCLGNPN